MTLFLLSSIVLLVIILIYTYLKRLYSRSINDPPGTEPHIFFGDLINYLEG
jgi:hypothetical protein